MEDFFFGFGHEIARPGLDEAADALDPGIGFTGPRAAVRFDAYQVRIKLPGIVFLVSVASCAVVIYIRVHIFSILIALPIIGVLLEYVYTTVYL